MYICSSKEFSSHETCSRLSCILIIPYLITLKSSTNRNQCSKDVLHSFCPGSSRSFQYPMTDLRKGAPGTRLPLSIFFHFVQFSGEIGPNNRLVPPALELRPSLGNAGSVTDSRSRSLGKGDHRISNLNGLSFTPTIPSFGHYYMSRTT